MGKVKYYDYEIEDRLRQVDINRNDIGMTQINVLPIPDGVLEGSGSSPRPIEFTAIGDRLTGKVSIEINGESNMREHPQFTLGWLTPLGRGEDDTGTIKPGKYLISFTCSMAASQLIERLHNRDDDKGSGWITVEVHDSESLVSTIIELGETETITVPENFEEVRIYYDIWVNDDTMASESFDDDVTFDIYPFLRLKALADEPFEPYKPDLQTQIINQQQVSARITDAIGTDGSINLFPIDKGTRTSPVIYQGVLGSWYIAHNGAASYIGYASTDVGTTEATEQYRTYYNIGYQFDDDHPFLYGDLVPGSYALSFDVSRRSHFDDCEVYYEVYASDDASDIDTLIATCAEGETITFDVTAENPYISIKPTVYRPSGESWENCQLITVPFLRRSTFVSSNADEYKPSVKKQLAELYALVSSASGGYNETQVETVTDNVEEVTE